MRFFTLSACTGLALALNAQWSTDATAPMVVCDAANDQMNMHAVPDAGTGWYAFWCDFRNNAQQAQLFGQHYDADGVAQWTANGELILDLPGRSINDEVPVLLPNGDVMIGVLSKAGSNTGADTARAIRIDANADMVWSEPALMSVNGTGIFGNCFGFSFLAGIASGDGAYFCYHGDSQGSNGYYVMQRVRADGSVAFDVPGIAVPYNAGYGPHEIEPDGADGMLVAWRCSNGAGTCHKAIRVDTLGAASWASNLDVAAGGAGLAYAFTTLADGTGSFVSVWEESGGDLGMARFDTTGTLLWTPSPFYACTESHSQGTPATAIANGELYVAWSDNRPPASNADLYMQKIDLSTGAKLWATDGVLVHHDNDYIPTARIVPAPDGAIGIMDMGGTSGYFAMRMLSDGTPAWSQPTSFCTALPPFYDQRTELPDGTGGVVSFWRSSDGNQVGNLYGARIYANGDLGNHVGLAEENFQTLRLFPNPATSVLNIPVPADVHVTYVEAIDVRGSRTRLPWNGGRAELGGLRAGAYGILIHTTSGTRHGRFIKL